MTRAPAIRLAGHLFPPAEWEAICVRCGRCCHEKEEHEGYVVFLDIPCVHLTDDRLCDCYEHRFEREPQCRRITPAMIAAQDMLPPDCAYVELYRELLDDHMEHPERGFRGWWRRRGRGR